MPLFRRREIIEAEQWFPGKAVAGVTEYAQVPVYDHWGQRVVQTAAWTELADGSHVFVNAGDWLVTTAAGRLVMRDADFRQAYEEVRE